MTDIEKLYTENSKAVYRYLVKLCSDVSLAEELTQETFYRAFMNLNGFRGDAKPFVWLCQIAKNLYFSWCRENKRFVPLEEIAQREDTAPTPENTIIAEEASAYAEKLEEPYRTVFMLKVCSQMSLKEISAVYGKSESWARVTYHRAKQKILENYGGTT